MFELVKVDKKFSLDPNSLPITIMTFNAMCIYVFFALAESLQYTESK